MSFRADIKEQYDRWLVEIKAAPDPTRDHVASHLRCPHCGDALLIRHGRHTERHFVYHPLTWCELRGAAWYGETREAAIAAFETNLSGKRVGYSECHDAATPPAQNPIIAGFEVSGLSEDEINKLLAEK